MNTLAQYVKYHGVTFTDFLFELKRIIFENNMASQYQEEEEEEESNDDEDDSKPQTPVKRPSSAEILSNLRN